MGSGFSRQCRAVNKETDEKGAKCNHCKDERHNPTKATSLTDAQGQNAHNLIANNTRDNGYLMSASAPGSHKGYPSTNQSQKKFFFYPKTGEQTMYVHTSQFPYTKPKIVAVKPRQLDEIENQQGQNTVCPGISNGVQTNHLNTASSNFAAEKVQYFHMQEEAPKQEFRFVNERRWSHPNTMPSDIMNAHGKLVLPHRTVLELRRSAHPVQPYGRHYAYTCDMEPTFPVELSGRRRPPTPDPGMWFPAQRSNDYLVASSLLAMEQQRERFNKDSTNMNDF